ncbi:MAG: DUF1840 family protein [Burkholderiales bacterium]|nr:DUF1840 family protein [Burkholderiales bacterium]MDE2396952.1 DUF1840 family protein [Burkholderiales bacterium]MDE2454523.1 DUF1840 family protein [Burkholderiales bacterium]
MSYKFKCKATGEVLMADPVGDRMLGVLGKPVAAQGIPQPGDMLSAIPALGLLPGQPLHRLHCQLRTSGSAAPDHAMAPRRCGCAKR